MGFSVADGVQIHLPDVEILRKISVAPVEIDGYFEGVSNLPLDIV